MDRVLAARQSKDPAAAEESVVLLKDLCDTMVAGSLCALGGMAPFPVLSAVQHFPEDFGLPTAALAAAGR
jgi:formate dehydrogenase iron-sulfur subunit